MAHEIINMIKNKAKQGFEYPQHEEHQHEEHQEIKA